MEKEEKFWENNFSIAIDQNGEKKSVPRKKYEFLHWKLFTRLNEKLENIIGDIDWNRDTSFNLPNKFAKKGVICIYPIELDYLEISEMPFGVIFPDNPNIKQLETLKGLYDKLEELSSVAYFEKPTDDVILDYDQIIQGLDKLKLFVEKKLTKLLSEQEQSEERL